MFKKVDVSILSNGTTNVIVIHHIVSYISQLCQFRRFLMDGVVFSFQCFESVFSPGITENTPKIFQEEIEQYVKLCKILINYTNLQIIKNMEVIHQSLRDQTLQSSLEDLPDEVLEFILGFLAPYKDLQNCMLVCKRLHACAQSKYGYQKYVMTCGNVLSWFQTNKFNKIVAPILFFSEKK